MPIRNLILLVVTTAVCLAAWAAREREARGRRFSEVMAIIDRSYLEPVDGESLFDAAVDAAVAKLDEHSAYLRGEDRRELESQLDQRFAGVGLELGVDDQTRSLVVLAPVGGSPAWKAGIRAGDRIEAIDDAATAGLPLRDAVRRLRGSPGTPVTLRVVTTTPTATRDPLAPAPEPPARDVVLLREIVAVESVLGDRRLPDGSWEWRIEGEPGLALVRIKSFGERTAGELDAALTTIAADPDLRGLVLDLRGNPGGLLSAAIEVCDRFLDEGEIVSTRGRSAGSGDTAADTAVVDVRRATAGAVLAGVPIAVLIDGLTASAAEIVAACLQDHGRAVVVGSRSFGKGTVQAILQLSDGRSLLKLTTSEYLRPGRANIHRRHGDGDADVWGVSPDPGCELAPTAEALERLRLWRRARDTAADPRRDVAGTTIGPRTADAVLEAALAILSPAADLGREKETARDADDPPPAGE